MKKRPIKFKAWALWGIKYEIQNKYRMIEGEELHKIGGIFYSGGIAYHNDPDSEEITLLQFTGLFDKNRKEIYEGDIVKLFGTITAEVYWEFGAWQLRNGDKAGGMLGSHDEESVEIIGNIFENPELLEV